jgi:RNA methyltransferase, TrmH family
MNMAASRNANSKMQTTGKASLITSRDNSWLKRFRAALAREQTGEGGIVGVEGLRLVEAALGSGLPVAAVLVSESGERHLARFRDSLAPEVHILRTTDRLFAGIADTQTPQGVAALVRPKLSTFEDVIRGDALVAVLVGVQDPGNEIGRAHV